MTGHAADWRCYSRGCRLDPCRNAWRIYAKKHRLAILQGEKPQAHMIPTTEVRAFLAHWKAKGIGVKAIAAATGVAPSTIYRVTITDTVRSTTADRIMSFQPRLNDLADRVKIDGTGTRRRLQALHATGWTWAEIGRELGCTGQNVRCIVEQVEARNGHVTAATARTVRDLYDRAWQGPPTPANGYQVGEQNRARRRATARGWPPPLAWDDDSIDDPAATPHATTSRSVHTRNRPAEHLAEDVGFVLDADPFATGAQVAARLGVTRDAVAQALKRTDRTDLINQLARNARLANGEAA